LHALSRRKAGHEKYSEDTCQGDAEVNQAISIH
jgi:hypothetical protein